MPPLSLVTTIKVLREQPALLKRLDDLADHHVHLMHHVGVRGHFGNAFHRRAEERVRRRVRAVGAIGGEMDVERTRLALLLRVGQTVVDEADRLLHQRLPDLAAVPVRQAGPIDRDHAAVERPLLQLRDLLRVTGDAVVLEEHEGRGLVAAQQHVGVIEAPLARARPSSAW